MLEKCWICRRGGTREGQRPRCPQKSETWDTWTFAGSRYLKAGHYATLSRHAGSYNPPASLPMVVCLKQWSVAKW